MDIGSHVEVGHTVHHLGDEIETGCSRMSAGEELLGGEEIPHAMRFVCRGKAGQPMSLNRADSEIR